MVAQGWQEGKMKRDYLLGMDDLLGNGKASELDRGGVGGCRRL